jgi:hypothetical protein
MGIRITERHWWKGTPGTAKTYLKHYGWRVWVAGLPVLWRWSPSIRLTLLPTDGWLFGVWAGFDHDEDFTVDVGLGPVFFAHIEFLTWMTYADYHERMDRIEELKTEGVG